jgi:hypothetical protein
MPYATNSDLACLVRSPVASQPTLPYFLSYEITDTRSATVFSTFVALESSNERHRQPLDIALRVLNYRFDNSHAVWGNFARADAMLDRFAGTSVIPVAADAE